MGALLVQMLTEAGVKSGDTIGAGFSGSFPTLNLAVLAAGEAMNVKVIYIASMGASTFGANQYTASASYALAANVSNIW